VESERFTTVQCKPALTDLPHSGQLVRQWIESGLASDHRRRFVCDRFNHMVSLQLHTQRELNQNMNTCTLYSNPLNVNVRFGLTHRHQSSFKELK
jgi:hypothetical protein